MKVAICGGTGFIGQAMSEKWIAEGHEVLVVTRSRPASEEQTELERSITYVTWDEMEQQPEPLEGLDALINLAGSSLSQRWTEAAKKSILSSRLQTVEAVARLMARLSSPPPVVIQASAMAIYGTSDTETFDESSPARVMDFPSRVVQAWEEAADGIEAERLVKLRISVVLGQDGGAFPKMILPYKLGIGGKIGSGRQWMSWIHLQDMVSLIEFCITRSDISGPVNAASPHPVTNDEFGRTAGSVYHRPHWLPVPGFALKALLGELSMILLDGQRVIPMKAERHGFHFRYPELKEALQELKQQ
ncbi:TIGR01777 family oxidoreductase [Paenibacillus sp. F411]|uniref:TIGR01777 family oxidoreductase n=1 Tax=Paenibacillus sp. F411 TaxID=2820239 RepID=UPI001AAFC6FF|nr:TIGR01777 family oxidoreductase [Paenibacillus sp. F411]MBO2944103.1 TIGR01777 family oxidoreductase [Paenibacillus sp. F411]